MSEGPWEWKLFLRVLHPAVAEQLVWPGITRFKFQLLQHVRDSNYVRDGDTGERHVFQIDRVDGSTPSA